MLDTLSTPGTQQHARTDITPIADPVLAEHAAEIRRLGKRLVDDIVEIGRHLVEARKHVAHGDWYIWIDVEFGWSVQTADRFIHLYEARRKLKSHKLWGLPLSSLYLLTAPKTPDAARAAIAERLEAGEKVSYAEVTEAIAQAKAADAEPAHQLSARLANGAGQVAPANADVKPNTKLNPLAWTVATPAERARFVNAIGWQSLVAALPSDWLSAIRDWLEARAPTQAIAINRSGNVIPDDLSIPASLRRDLPTSEAAS